MSKTSHTKNDLIFLRYKFYIVWYLSVHYLFNSNNNNNNNNTVRQKKKRNNINTAVAVVYMKNEFRLLKHTFQNTSTSPYTIEKNNYCIFFLKKMTSRYNGKHHKNFFLSNTRKLRVIMVNGFWKYSPIYLF